jgi:hypothetical protein
VNQQWVFDPDQGRIIYGGNIDEANPNPLMCLDSHDMSGGTTLFIWGCNGLPAQNWGYDPNQFTVFLAQSDDRHVGHPRASMCVDLYNGDYSKGGQIQIWDCNGCWNQQWTVGVGFKTQTAALDRTAMALPSTNSRLCDCPPLVPKPKSCTKARWSPAEHTTWQASADTCVGGWPNFADASTLVASPWCQYFMGVYGEVSAAGARRRRGGKGWHCPRCLSHHYRH